MTDIIVIGGGIAGLSAARIEQHNGASRVRILNKAGARYLRNSGSLIPRGLMIIVPDRLR